MAKLAKEKQEIVENGEEFIYEAIGAETREDIESRTELFNELTREFTTALGKQESRRERNAQGLDSINFTYGEVDFKSIYQVFKWI